MNKLRDSTKAKDDEITRNLVGLARTRPDIFGETRTLSIMVLFPSASCCTPCYPSSSLECPPAPYPQDLLTRKSLKWSVHRSARSSCRGQAGPLCGMGPVNLQKATSRPSR